MCPSALYVWTYVNISYFKSKRRKKWHMFKFAYIISKIYHLKIIFKGQAWEKNKYINR